jgi:O-antigen/teichoic acid export membrane protein
MNQLKYSKNLTSFISDTLIYSILNITNKFIPFLLLPIIIRMLSTADYGQYSFFITIETMLIPIVTLNVNAALSRHFYSDDIILSEYLSTLVYSIFGFSIIALLLLAALPDSVILKIGITRININFSIIAAAIAGIISIVLNLFRLQRRPWLYGLFSVIQSLFLFFSIYIFCSLKSTSEMVIYGRVVYYFIILFFVIYFLYNRSYLLQKFQFKYLKRVLKFSFPTLIYSLTALVFLSSDRIFIKYYLGDQAIGFYSAIYQLSSLVSILGMSMNAAWMPWLFENLKKKNEATNIFIVKISYLLVILFFLFGLIYSLLFPYLAKFILPISYEKYFYLAIPLIFGFVFEGIYLVVSPYLYYAEKTKYNAYIGIFISLINVSINFILIPFYGIGIAAISFFCSWFLLACLFFIISNRVYPMPWLSLKV